MFIQFFPACLMAFVACFLLGKKMIPWLKNHHASQPLKKEVAETIYEENRNSDLH